MDDKDYQYIFATFPSLWYSEVSVQGRSVRGSGHSVNNLHMYSHQQ